MTLPEPHWLTPPPGITLAGDEIHIWRALLDQPANRVEGLTLSLADDERQRADRFHLVRDRRRFIVGRGVLRRILGHYLNIDPGQVQFGYGSRGKPYLATASGDFGLGFNLAHAGPLAVYAFSHNRAIGIDVEQVRPLPDADLIASRFFSVSENAAYRELAEDRKEMGFYLCWTRKEAYLKALGEGLARPLELFDVSLLPGEPARLLHVAWDPDEVSRWSLVSLEPWPGFVAAVAVQGHDWHANFWEYE